jgi:uncharacterized protein YjeT (DUF2065 family)
MNTSTVVGSFLIAVGCLFVLAGLARFCIDTFAQAGSASKRGFAATDPEKWSKLVEQLGKLPPWALSAVLGIALIAAGQWIQAGHMLGG